MANACPTCTTSAKTNIANHLKCIEVAALGPADPRQPSTEFWADKAKKWNVKEGEARARLCLNCEHYIATKEMQDCIAQGPGGKVKASALPVKPKWADIAGMPTAVCSLYNITCSAIRTCDDWEEGGPVTDDLETEDNDMEETKLSELKPGMIEFAGGYAMREGDNSKIYKEAGVKAHLKRNAARYVGAAGILPMLTGNPLATVAGGGLLIGAKIVGDKRAAKNLTKTLAEKRRLKPWDKGRAAYGIVPTGDGEARLLPMSALTRRIELARGDRILKLLPNMSMGRMEGDALEAMLRKKPEIIAPHVGYDPAEIAEFKKAIPAQRKLMARNVRSLYRMKKISDRLGAVEASVNAAGRAYGIKGFESLNPGMVAFARGDFAIPALKKALAKGIGNAGERVSIHEIGAAGTTIPSLRKNPKQVKRALDKFWGEKHDLAESTAYMKGTRKWAADTLRSQRQIQKNAGKWPPSPVLMPSGPPVFGRYFDRSSTLQPGTIEFMLGGDNRPRNGNGQFVANETEGMDPNSMQAAYGGVEQEKMARRQGLIARMKAMMGKSDVAGGE